MQDLIVYLVVAGAVAYLVRMIWSALVGGKSGCNSCGSNCAAHLPKVTRASSAQPLIQIDLQPKNKH
jgi:hypothetical protein